MQEAETAGLSHVACQELHQLYEPIDYLMSYPMLRPASGGISWLPAGSLLQQRLVDWSAIGAVSGITGLPPASESQKA